MRPRRTTIGITALATGLLAISPLVGASVATAADSRSGTVVSEQLPSGNTMNVYVPDGDDTGMRAASTPQFILLADDALSATELQNVAETSGLAEIVAREQGVLTSMNPLGDEWSEQDAAGFVELLGRYSDGTGEPYDRDGQLCNTGDDGTERCTYPGAVSRVYLFADGAGADFASEHVVPGLGMPLPFPDRDGNPIVPVVTPAAVWLSNARAAAGDLTVDVEVPAYLINPSDAATSSYEAINTVGGKVVVSDSAATETFDRDAVEAGYDSFMRLLINRASLVQPEMQNYDIMDYAAEGVTQKHETVQVDGGDIEYFSYTPDDLPDSGVPLVMAFHGGGNHAEFLMFATRWPELAKQEGFVVVSVNGHIDNTPAQVVELVDDLLAEDPRLDASRVYATGFSMGSIKTWALSAEFPERFAAVAPTNGAFAPEGADPASVAVPTIYFAGLSSFLPEVPHQECDLTSCKPKEPNAIDARLQTLFAQNDVADAWTYDESAHPIWGIEPASTETIDDPLFDGVSVEVIDVPSANGDVITRLAGVTNGHHESLPIQATIAWDFMSQFARGDNGEVVRIADVDAEAPAASDAAVIWPWIVGGVIIAGAAVVILVAVGRSRRSRTS